MDVLKDRSGEDLVEGIYYSDYPYHNSNGCDKERVFNRYFYRVISRNGGFYLKSADDSECMLSENYAKSLTRIRNECGFSKYLDGLNSLLICCDLETT